MEKTTCSRLNSYIERLSILCPRQYGFRTGHSTDLALVNIQDLITNKHAVGIFPDLAKAFDMVDHNLLIQKMEYYGIRGITLKWFKDYLSNWQQQVRCNGAVSTLRPIKCGVPQGSNQGPLLFLLYINDLPKVCKMLNVILFADDTVEKMEVLSLSSSFWHME